MLPSDWHAFLRWRTIAGCFGILLRTSTFVNALGALQEAALLYGTTALAARYGPGARVAVTIGRAIGTGRGQVRDIFGERMLRADVGDAAFRCFAGFGKRIVAGVEILTLLLARQLLCV